MAMIVYALCALTSFACAAILLRAYSKTRFQLLLWAGICFVGFAANNLVLFIDVSIGPRYDLSLFRGAFGLSGLVFLLYGLIWDTVGG